MAPSTTPHPDSSFTISSGALCFGSRSEMRQGSQAAIQTPQPAAFASAAPGATVLNHKWEYNFRALNGEWKVYRLVQQQQQQQQQQEQEQEQEQEEEAPQTVVAAFCCHESISPLDEAQRILKIANSPYERDNGTNRNTESTWEGRVLVVNRYDWGEDYHQEYHEDGIMWGEDDDDEDDDEHNEHNNNNSSANYYYNPNAMRNSRWLVDYEQVRQEPDDWRLWRDGQTGIRMVVQGEYMFCRFGLTPDRSAVHSFLWFTADTQLAHTVFYSDNDQPVYVPLTPEQRHAKRLQDGSYLGYQFLNQFDEARRPQLKEQLVGPLFGGDNDPQSKSNKTLFLISADSVNGLLEIVQPKAPILEPQLQAHSTRLLNECLGSWLVKVVVPKAEQFMAKQGESTTTTTNTMTTSGDSSPTLREQFLAEAFASEKIQNNTYDNNKTMNKLLLDAMQQPNAKAMELSTDALYALLPRDTCPLWKVWTVDDLSRSARVILGEVLELAGNTARDNERSVVVPYDVRVVINMDQELVETLHLNKSRFFWPPDF